MRKVNILQLQTRLDDRDWYVSQGFPADVAEQYSYDHMFASKKRSNRSKMAQED